MTHVDGFAIFFFLAAFALGGWLGCCVVTGLCLHTIARLLDWRDERRDAEIARLKAEVARLDVGATGEHAPPAAPMIVQRDLPPPPPCPACRSFDVARFLSDAAYPAAYACERCEFEWTGEVTR